MELQPPRPLPKPSTPKSTSFISHGLFNLPATPTPEDGFAFITLHESNHSLRTLFRSTDHDELESKTTITFYHDDDNNKPPIAFADDLFHHGLIMPLSPPSLKLPPRLQVVGGGGASPRSPHTNSSPKSPRKIRGLKEWKDIDPFAAAVERIRKEDATLEPFHWRQLERSFKDNFDRVFDDECGESGWDLVGGVEGEMNTGRRSNNFYCRLNMKERRCCKKGRHNWKLLSCFLTKKGWDGEKHSS